MARALSTYLLIYNPNLDTLSVLFIDSQINIKINTMQTPTSQFQNTRYLFSLFCFLMLVLLATLSIAEEQKLEIKSYDWQGAIPANQLVIVKNPYGDIRSRTNGEQKVFLHATIQEIGDRPLSPEFSIKEVNGNIEIEVVYPKSVKDKQGNLLGRTDLSVLFPPNVKIIAETTQGMIKIDKSASDLEAKTTSGTIKLTTSGLFKAETETGIISLRLRGMHTAGTSSASARSGKIKVDVFDDMDIKLHASTKGQIDLNGNPINQDQLFRRQGQANSKVELISETGDISVNIIKPPELVKSVKPVKKAINLKDLPKSEPWKEGDPVKEINPKRNNTSKR